MKTGANKIITKVITVFIVIMGIFTGHPETSICADTSAWENKVKTNCAQYGSIMGPQALQLKSTGLTKDAALAAIEESMQSQDAVSKTISLKLVKAIYEMPMKGTVGEIINKSSEKAQDICIKERLKDDPAGLKAKAREDEEKRITKKTREENARAEKREQKRIESEEIAQREEYMKKAKEEYSDEAWEYMQQLKDKEYNIGEIHSGVMWEKQYFYGMSKKAEISLIDEVIQKRGLHPKK